MKSPKNLLVVLLALFICFSIQNISSAQTAPPKKDPAVKKQVIESDKPKEQPAKGGLCDCLKGAGDVLAGVFQKLEEEDWNTGIKAAKDAINTINTVAKTCACPEIIAYQKIAEAYLSYAEGGNHLDSAEEPDCPKATKLYSGAIGLFEKYVPQITNPAIRENAKDIEGYVKEEKEFVDEECNGTQSQEKSKGAGETKEKKQ